MPLEQTLDTLVVKLDRLVVLAETLLQRFDEYAAGQQTAPGKATVSSSADPHPTPGETPAPHVAPEPADEAFNANALISRAIAWAERNGQEALIAKMGNLDKEARKLSDLSEQNQRQLFEELAA